VHRRKLLERLGLPFQQVDPAVDESEIAGEAPPQRARRLATLKATSVAAQFPRAIVIGSDQVCALGQGLNASVLRKPGTRANCITQLAAMSGQTVQFHTALVTMQGSTKHAHLDTTTVQFRSLTRVEIERYVDLEPAFDCAGGFKCEGLGVSLFESIETRDPTALIGLPLIAVCAALRALDER
jgi:septum formation protein